MDSTLMLIADFLSARYDEEEQLANAARRDAALHWRHSPALGNRVRIHTPDPINDEIGITGAAVAAHITCHDPARVLDDLWAKREIIAQCRRAARDTDTDSAVLGALELTLRHLAHVHAAHPGYDHAWSPINEDLEVWSST